MIEWLIVGGGIHGVHLAVRLLQQSGVAPDQVRIVDPAEELLERWRVCTATTGMTHLRSPGVHHLGVRPFSLKQFARDRHRGRVGLFAGRYERPSLDLFNGHCRWLIARHGLSDLHERCRAEAITLEPEQVSVLTSGGIRIEARNLILAMGAGEQPFRPQWAAGLPRVHHLFEPDLPWPESPETVAVVGGGLSAAQAAFRLAAEGHQVHLISRHQLRAHRFDSSPGWLGPKNMAEYQRVTDLGRRRQLIQQARHRGSVPPTVRRAMGRAVRQKAISWHEAEIVNASADARGICLESPAEPPLIVDRVLLATGFEARRPGGSLVDRLVEENDLPCAACGYPRTDRALRWHPRIVVTGPLAELELGPVARNIAGARRAGERLVASMGSCQRSNDD